MKLTLKIIEILAYMAISYIFFNWINHVTDFYQAAFFAATALIFAVLAGFCCYYLERFLTLKRKFMNIKTTKILELTADEIVSIGSQISAKIIDQIDSDFCEIKDLSVELNEGVEVSVSAVIVSDYVKHPDYNELLFRNLTQFEAQFFDKDGDILTISVDAEDQLRDEVEGRLPPC